MCSEEPLYYGHLGTRKDCPHCWGVLISGVEDVLWLIIAKHIVPVVCFIIRMVSALQEAGLEGFPCVRM